MQDFASKYNQEINHKAVIGEKIRNRHNYLKTCAVNYLSEYKASDMIPSFETSKAGIDGYLNFLKRGNKVCSLN